MWWEYDRARQLRIKEQRFQTEIAGSTCYALIMQQLLFSVTTASFKKKKYTWETLDRSTHQRKKRLEFCMFF